MSIHKAFDIEMQEAFNLNSTGIVTLFDDINTRLDHYQVIDNTPTRESFPKVLGRIKTLLQRNSIFPDGAALTVSYQGTNFELETLFDLVGWIFSVTGHIPEDATAVNYYYPLVILYCQWCRTLCGNKDKEPQMVQITWFPQEGTKRVCLGSNMDRPKKLRKAVARKRRFDMLVRDGLARADELEANYMTEGGHLIGYCAETFPMLFIKSLKNKVTVADAIGVAVKPFRALEFHDKFTIPVTVKLRRELLENPCRNCQVVLTRLGCIDLTNFSILDFHNF
ncbi:hypothetical protein BDR05DRAFT_970686 [Suillus weaverae]|nr:hypothetical protein BDR05DRAFT_970686 [Suillus weaverae]